VKAAIVFTYTRPWAGREPQAMQAFTDALTFWGKLAATDRCSEPIPYLGSSGTGMMIVHGDRDELFGILDTDEFRAMYSKVTYCVPDVRYELVAAGEGVQEMMTNWAAAGIELGFM
jgi:hypothetical protein